MENKKLSKEEEKQIERKIRWLIDMQDHKRFQANNFIFLFLSYISMMLMIWSATSTILFTQVKYPLNLFSYVFFSLLIVLLIILQRGKFKDIIKGNDKNFLKNENQIEKLYSQLGIEKSDII